MPNATKTCPTCKVDQPVSNFGKNKARSDGLAFYCKACSRTNYRTYRDTKPAHAERNRQRLRDLYADQPRYLDYLYRSKFGISWAEYERMLEEQAGGCGICGKQQAEGAPRLSVDHDHTCCPGKRSCGKCVRGLLCSDCNFGIGKFRDQPDLLIKAASYLTA